MRIGVDDWKSFKKKPTKKITIPTKYSRYDEMRNNMTTKSTQP